MNDTPSAIRIFMLGRFAIEVNGCSSAPSEGGKGQSLLCYLLVYRDHSHSRELLASRFWEDTTTAASKKHLRQALWQLQTAIGDQARPPSARVLVVEPDWVRINPEADIRLDTVDFERIYAAVQDKPGESFDDAEGEAVRAALALYRGDLLEGCYDDWCVYERERLQNMMLMLLDKLMGSCEARRRYELGVEYGERILRYDHASERTHRRLMRLHYLNGDRTAALRQFERCRHALRTELGIEPAAPITLLYEQIRADRLEAAQSPVPSGHTPARREQAIAEGAEHTQLEASLVALQQQVSSTLRVLRNTRSADH